MEIIAMSSSSELKDEVKEVVQMFEMGLRQFHVRKPRLSRKELSAYIQRFPEEYRDRLILHSYHALVDQYKLGGMHLGRKHRRRRALYKFRLWLKRKQQPHLTITRTFHKLTDINLDKHTYSYAFLSPVFDSVSKNSLGGGYSPRALLIMLPQARQPIYAMGGVHPGNIADAARLGFEEALLLGALWTGQLPPSEVYAQALKAAEGLKYQ